MTPGDAHQCDSIRGTEGPKAALFSSVGDDGNWLQLLDDFVRRTSAASMGLMRCLATWHAQ